MDTYTIRKELVKIMNAETTSKEEKEKLEAIGQQLLSMDTGMVEKDYEDFFSATIVKQ